MEHSLTLYSTHLVDELNDFEITEEKVRKLLASLQTNKVAGPDGINFAVWVE